MDSNQKRSPHLVPYDLVDQRIKDANKESAAEFIKALQLFGIFLEPPVHEHDEGYAIFLYLNFRGLLIFGILLIVVLKYLVINEIMNDL